MRAQQTAQARIAVVHIEDHVIAKKRDSDGER
jgi:hypothetical protein